MSTNKPGSKVALLRRSLRSFSFLELESDAEALMTRDSVSLSTSKCFMQTSIWGIDMFPYVTLGDACGFPAATESNEHAATVTLPPAQVHNQLLDGDEQGTLVALEVPQAGILKTPGASGAADEVLHASKAPGEEQSHLQITIPIPKASGGGINAADAQGELWQHLRL